MFEIKFKKERRDVELLRRAGIIADIRISIEKEGIRIGDIVGAEGYFTVDIGPFFDVNLSSFDKLHSGQTIPFEMELYSIIFEGDEDTVEIYIHDEHRDEFGEEITVELQTFAAAMISFAEEFVAYCREEEFIEESSLQRMDEQISDARTWYSQTYSEGLE